MTQLAMYSLALGLIVSVLSIMTWRAGGKRLFPVGLMSAALGATSLIPEGWPRYIVLGLFISLVVWTLATATRAVFSRYRWGLFLVATALAGILIVELSPAFVRENEHFVVSLVGVIMIAGLAMLAFLALRDLLTAPKQIR